MFDDPGFDEARRLCNIIADHLRRHGPFEPHRLPMDEMEYTTLPEVMAKLVGRWHPIKERQTEPAGSNWESGLGDSVMKHDPGRRRNTLNLEQKQGDPGRSLRE